MALTLMATMSLGTVTALATTKNPEEGGTWQYGNCYSNYYHPDTEHGSSCCNGNEDWDQDYNRPADSWSKASVTSTWGGNKAYYNTGHRG